MNAADALALPASVLAARLAEESLDPVELAEAALEAIGRVDADATIYARTMPERARAEALAARARLSEGRPASALDGVPVSWKDLFDTAGTATESGSPFLKGRVPEADATLVARGAKAGWVGLGKTHQTELAFSGLGVNPKTATPPNRAMPGHAPGGSSSGAAASLTHGLAALAMGSDTGGSVRIPACWTNTVGLKVTHGALPDAGMVPLCPAFDTPGPLARTVEDARLAFEILSGRDGFATRPETPALADLRLLVCENGFLEDVEPAVLASFEAALERLSRAGARLTRGRLPAVTDGAELTGPLFGADAWATWGRRIEQDGALMHPPVRARFESGRGLAPERLAEAKAAMHRDRAAYLEQSAGFDAVLSPTCAILPPRVEALLADDALFMAENLRALRNTRFVNRLGLCALTLPLPETACGLQVIARPFGEARLLAVGAALEGPARG